MTKGQNMDNVKTIHHIKALAIAHHLVRRARIHDKRDLSMMELIEIEVAIKMALDDLTSDAVRS
jgi:hypothetical protein